MSKCIILSRVSTEKQTLEQQTELLVKKAKKEGYYDKDIIIIENKESAIKLKSNERKGISKLKKTIEENDDVDCVYIYEISRLGRRMDVLIEMRDYLVENKLQLYIYNNNIYLLDNNGEISQMAKMMFTIMSQFAESEMEYKKDRMLRGLLYKRSQNKYIGGNIAFGYKLNEEKEIVIDEEKANIIRKVFNDYEKGLSLGSITKELFEKGGIKAENLKSAIGKVTKWIHCKSYIGEYEVGHYKYKQIISKEQFERCQKICANKEKPKSNIKHIYWCKDLIVLKGTKLILSPSLGAVVYRRINKNNKSDLSVNINFMDSFTWHLVKQYRLDNADFDAASESNYASKMKKDAEIKLKQCDERIERLRKEFKRAEQLYLKGKRTENWLEDEERRISFKISEIELEKDKHNRTITDMMNRLIYASSWFYKKSFDEPKSDEEIFEIIHNDIEKIEIERHEKPHTYNIVYFFKNGVIKKYELYKSSKLTIVKDNKENEVKFEFIERFKRKKYIK